jgi:hypothetical protein
MFRDGRLTGCARRPRWTLDKYAARVPHDGRTFVNPRSCFGFRFKRTNVVLHAVGECNSHASCTPWGIGSSDASARASLAGLVPITRQSGIWRGRSCIQGGRASLRQALYMPAIVAMRFNPDLKRVYDRLIARLELELNNASERLIY